MIVRCERCETRFKLDESRIPARGARVRCSRCKHAFFVTPPGVAKAELVHEVAAEAARAPAEKARAPEPSWDLEEGPEATIARRKAAAGTTLRGPGSEREEDNTDWRFEDDVPGLDPGASRSGFDLSGSQTSPSLAAPDPDESSFAELGDPATWDLLAGDAPPADGIDPEPSIAAIDPGSTPPSPAPTPAASVTAPAAVAPAVVEEAPAPAPVPAPRPRIAPPAARTAFAPPAVVTPRLTPAAPRASWAGWAGLAVLVAVLAWGSLRPIAPQTHETSLAPIAGFEVVEARARVVENAAAGPLLVVSGRVRNPGPAARPLGAPLHVQLLDGDGTPLARGAAPVGPALPDARLREDAPEALAAAQQAGAAALASTPVAAGAELAFSAVFAPPPRDASRFALALPSGAAR